MALVLVLLAVAFIALLRNLNRMLYGVPPTALRPGENEPWALVPLGLCASVLLVLGIVLPSPLNGLLNTIVKIVSP
jgi:hydrogenase-4 component F